MYVNVKRRIIRTRDSAGSIPERLESLDSFLYTTQNGYVFVATSVTRSINVRQKLFGCTLSWASERAFSRANVDAEVPYARDQVPLTVYTVYRFIWLPV